MTQQEEEACVCLLINTTDASVDENVSKSFQERISKRKKRTQVIWMARMSVQSTITSIT